MHHSDNLNTFGDSSIDYKMTREPSNSKLAHSLLAMAKNSAWLADGWMTEQETVGGFGGFEETQRQLVA
jgi:hypothetical protein